MYSPRKKLTTPENYGFPYEPYAIQTDLMKSLYNVLEEKAIGIFESPTGTGKSLTLTCAALRWLEDHDQVIREEVRDRVAEKRAKICELEKNSQEAVDWISAQYETNQERAELSDLLALSESIRSYDEGLEKIRKRQMERKKKRERRGTEAEDGHDDTSKSAMEKELRDILETETNAPKKEEEEVKEGFQPIQIFFCSRTHSQLVQVVNEVKRTEYGQRIRCITLGSRQQLCVNPQVKRIKNTSLMSERCLELCEESKSAKPATSNESEEIVKSKNAAGCPFRTANAVQALTEAALADILDIEDLAAEGTEQKACAYYAARAATAAGQLIMLPYQMLLHRRTRMRSGIDLRGSVVIIDEAHNLLDTIAQLHSCEINLKQLLEIKGAMLSYKTRYVKRLNAINLLSINQLIYVVKRLVKLLEPKETSIASPEQQDGNKASSRTMRTYELTAEGDFFNIDLFELLQFCERTRFAQKLLGFLKVVGSQDDKPKENCAPESKETATVQLLQRLERDKIESESKKGRKMTNSSLPIEAAEPEPHSDPASSTSIYSFLTFLEALTENAEDGRVLIKNEGPPEASSFRYTVLNPSKYFEDVIRETRAIVIAGGTMQPTNELTEQLFRACATRVRLHFYDHVVSKEAVLPFVVQSGSTGKKLCFNYTQRSSAEMLTELAMVLQNLSQVIPAGIVCFFPSYDFLDKVFDHLQRINALEGINRKKTVFRESRAGQKGQGVDKLLKDYAAAIRNKGGAFLFSVVGGKLSEGLNFKDDLCRGVIVVGMPYANSQSIELQERMRCMVATLGAGAGNQYYENLCMKAVNQCIGRAVRHVNDYAAIYLLDERYSQEHIQHKLPKWIARNLKIPPTFGLIQATTAKFFKQKREQIS